MLTGGNSPRKPIVLVSHNKCDLRLVQAIIKALKDADVNPIFYSDFMLSDKADKSISAADEIANLIEPSWTSIHLYSQGYSVDYENGYTESRRGVPMNQVSPTRGENFHHGGTENTEIFLDFSL